MPEAFAQALATPGLIWLSLAILIAGVVYGFAGFGPALVFMPIALLFVPAAQAVGALAFTALGSLITVVPGAWRAADRRASVTMLAAAVFFLPVGVWVLRSSEPVLLQWAVVAIVFVSLGALVTGWRITARPGFRTWLAVGGGVGFFGGSTGLTGPVLVLFQLAGSDPVARVRGNSIIVLTMSGVAILPALALQGMLPLQTLGLGALLLVPYTVGTAIGQRIFSPEREHLYRNVAYLIIAAAGLLGLPIFR